MKDLAAWTGAGTCEDLKDVFCCRDSITDADLLLEEPCTNCKKKLFIENHVVHVPSEGQDATYLGLQFKHCSCKSHTFLWCCRKWVNVDILLDTAVFSEAKILKKATAPKDYILIYLLGQISHNLNDLDLSLMESPVGYGNFHFTYKVLLQDGHAKGFCILKEKGERQTANASCDFFPTVDFLYVRKKYRNRGLGGFVMQNLLEENSGKDLYFSMPISIPLSKVLISLLRRSAALRNSLWGIDGEMQQRFSMYYYLMLEYL